MNRLQPSTKEVADLLRALSASDVLKTPEGRAEVARDLTSTLRVIHARDCWAGCPCRTEAVRNAICEAVAALDLAQDHMAFLKRRFTELPRLA